MSTVLRNRFFVWLHVALVAGALSIARPASAQLSVAVGDLFPDFSALDQSNAPFTLSDHRGKVVLLHICTMWCAPCLQSARDEQEISAAIDEAIGPGNWLFVDALVQNNLFDAPTQANAIAWRAVLHTPALTLHANGDVASELYQLPTTIGLDFFPTYVVIAPDGKVSAIHTGYAAGSSPPFDGDAAVLVQLTIDAAKTPGVMLQTLAGQVQGAGLPHGTTNSLGAHLRNAARLLEDENTNNDAAAINVLEAFINQVRALAGKKISESDAADLIAGAEEIIALLTG